MLQIRELSEIKNDPKKVEKLLTEEEMKLLHAYEERMKRAVAENQQYIVVNEMPLALENLLTMNRYSVRLVDSNNIYMISWLWENVENNQENPKRVINLQDGSSVEIDGINVKHVKENEVMYDSTNRIAYNQENIDNVKNRLASPCK